MEVGPTEMRGMGQAPVSWLELLAWQIDMHRMLQPWECEMIRRLSIEWVAESARAEDPSCPAPFTDGSGESLKSTARSLRDLISGMAQ